MKPTFPEQKITDARRYIAALLDSDKITIEEYSEASWILDSARLKSWLSDEVRISPCDYIKAYAKAVEVEFGPKWYN